MPELNPSQFSHFSGCFQFFFIIDAAAMDIFTHFFSAELFPQDKFPEVKNTESMGMNIFSCFASHIAILLYNWIEPNYNPPEVYTCTSFTKNSSVVGVTMKNR